MAIISYPRGIFFTQKASLPLEIFTDSLKLIKMKCYIDISTSYTLSVDIECGNCGKIIKTMKLLRSLKDTMGSFSNRCPLCGKSLSVADFSIDVEKL
ncbi:hypothetical protein [Nitrosopumilus sp.]|uniref:hypothetical protein n=1 Tax=Nitrosopumilus sp. TaxID=2024843 RepID=UPI003B58D27E